MTHDDIKRLLDAATPGPWERGIAGNNNVVSFDGNDIKGIACAAPRNADLIAAAPTIIRQLLDENQRLRAAMTGWSGYGWHDGIYYDDLQEYFDGILEENAAKLDSSK